ncbi:MAG: tRNA lysidine(34) synthetase TilS [Amaricoccus sp.]
MSVPSDLRAIVAAAPAGEIGVAVSGGGDSVALLLMLREAVEAAGRTVAAVTVDHGLRPEAAEEAAAVAVLCARLGVPHAVLRWEGWDGRGNMQDRARAARRALIAQWARSRGIGAVALGHTLDDQAETVLLRLARGSGVDGLAAMAPVAGGEGILWLRPLLGVRRGALRIWLAGQGVGWAEDPSNDDPRFDRVRVRAALPALAALGIGPERLAATARAMARARAALEAATAELGRRAVEEGPAGDLEIDPAGLAGAPEEIRLRLLAAALGWVSGAVLRPRLMRLEAALAAIEAGRVGHGLTLNGCVLRVRAGRVAVRREPARTAAAVPLAAGRWDGRWELFGRPPEGQGMTIGALGAGGLARLAPLPPGIARETLATTPAVWRAGELVAAPLARPEPDFGFRRAYAGIKPWSGD